MERVINQFKSSDAYSRDKFYLFFLDNAKDPNIKGFMPFKKQFGFIFKYQQYPDEYMRTIAHELGHGALRLWHTFSSNNQYIQPEGSTNNLMDYVDRSKADSAIFLNKYQWDWAHDPTWRIYAFEDQEEAEMGGNLFIANIIDYISQIRQGNKEKKSEISIKLITGIGEYGLYSKVRLGNNDFSYIKMLTTGFNSYLDVESGERPSYNIKPSELSVTSYFENGIKYVKYTFHEVKTVKNGVPYADTREPNGVKRVEIFVLAKESLKFEQYLFPLDEKFLDAITWVSQFDESKFSLCSGCWSTSCCRRACEYMLGNTNIANCIDKTIAANAPYMNVLGNITLASFTDNLSKYSKDSYNSTVLNSNSNNIETALKYVKDKLNSGRPVIIGVHFGNGNSAPPNNANKATRHFMVIVGLGSEGDNEYFRFYDPGRSIQNETAATSPNNKFVLNRQKGFFQCSYNDKTYTITEIIKTQ